jgi:hypothetical protein
MSSQEPEPDPAPPPTGLMRNPVVPAATMIGLGGLLIVVGSFMPWMTASAPLVGTISTSGMQGGDGVITLVLGVITILIGVTQLTATNMPTSLQRSSIVTGVITGAVAIYDYNEVQDRITQAKAQSDLIIASVGGGMWALFVGAALAIIGGVLIRKVPKLPDTYRTWPTGP